MGGSRQALPVPSVKSARRRRGSRNALQKAEEEMLGPASLAFAYREPKIAVPSLT